MYTCLPVVPRGGATYSSVYLCNGRAVHTFSEIFWIIITNSPSAEPLSLRHAVHYLSMHDGEGGRKPIAERQKLAGSGYIGISTRPGAITLARTVRADRRFSTITCSPTEAFARALPRDVTEKAPLLAKIIT